ncbi:hypothetical protein O3M35_010638 [Rhynocoris fuscipes]|uniref:Uncharacterized protein n=1 Tax=Rhynocoris fuscipes TaxID=488301 RepID=A0AAW1D6R4_9HEMI
MYTKRGQNDQNLDPSLFIYGMKGYGIECNHQPTTVQFHKYITPTKGFYNLHNLMDVTEDDDKVGSKPHRCRNPTTYKGFKSKKENTELAVMNTSDATNSQIKYEDNGIIKPKASCLSQDSCVSLIYSCSPQSLPCLINSECDAIASRDSLSCTSYNYCIPCDGDSEIYSENDVSIMKFLNRFKLLKRNMIDYNSIYGPQYLDISYTVNKKFYNNLKINKKVKHQEIQTSSDLLNHDIVDRQAIKKCEVIDSTIDETKNSDELNLVNNVNNNVSFSEDSMSDFDSHKQYFPYYNYLQNHQKSIQNVSNQEVIEHQHHPSSLLNDSGFTTTDRTMSFESNYDFDNEYYDLKKTFIREMKNKYKEAINVITNNNKLEFNQMKSEIFESFGENENSYDNYVSENSSKVIDKFVPLPSLQVNSVAIIPEKVLYSNTADMPQNDLYSKHNENEILNDNIVTENKRGKSKNISKLMHMFGNVNSMRSEQREFSITNESPLVQRKDDFTLPTDDIEFSLTITGDYQSSSKQAMNSYNTDVKENEFEDFMFREIAENSKISESRNDCIAFTPADDFKFQTNTQKRPVSDNIILSNGKPAVLFNRCGFPLTDLKGRKLRNIFGTELLPINNIEELISSELLVYDCFNVSNKQKHFNPINGINEKIIQIVGKNNEPTHLYNSLGYPLNDEDGVLLYDSRGNLMVILDNSGSPMMCINNDSIYLKDGTAWSHVKDYHNVFHYAKDNKTLNSTNIIDKNNYNESIEDYHLPFIQEFYNLDDNKQQNETVVAETYSTDLSKKMEYLSGFSQIISEIELSLKVSDYYKSLLKEHIKLSHLRY